MMACHERVSRIWIILTRKREVQVREVQVYLGTVVVIVLATSHRVRVAKIGTASGSERLYKDRLWRVSGKQHQSPELSIHLV